MRDALRLSMERRRGIGPLAASLGIGIALSLLAAAITVLAQPALNNARFLVFIVAVVVASLYGGATAGGICTVAGMLLITFLLLPPPASFQVTSLADIVALLLFVGGGTLVTWLTTTRTTARRRVRAQEYALKESDTARRESEDIFRLLVQSVTDYAIFLLDAEGTVLTWNPGAERIKGYRPEEIIGAHFSQFYTEEDRRAGKPKRGLEIAAREGHYLDEGWRLQKDGARFWASVVITALREPDGRLRGFAKVTRDLTERKRADEALQQALVSVEQRVLERTAKLHEANEALEAYAFTISHDVRAQLRGIRGYADALLEDLAKTVSSEHRQYLQRLSQSAALLDQITEQLLQYSRLGTAEIALKTVPLESVVEAALQGLRAELERASVTVERPLPLACANPAILTQVVVNLVTNALKFVGPNVRPDVRISASQHADRVRLCIEDKGIGIAPEDQERIFRPFERLHAYQTYPGTGIGLGIVKRAVQRMDGTVGVESSLGQGSRFWIELPIPQEVAHGIPRRDH
jgi:PAS domain S-box-containing protein